MDKFKYLRALKGHKQVRQAQNLQHDFHNGMYFTIFFLFSYQSFNFYPTLGRFLLSDRTDSCLSNTKLLFFFVLSKFLFLLNSQFFYSFWLTIFCSHSSMVVLLCFVKQSSIFFYIMFFFCTKLRFVDVFIFMNIVWIHFFFLYQNTLTIFMYIFCLSSLPFMVFFFWFCEYCLSIIFLFSIKTL